MTARTRHSAFLALIQCHCFTYTRTAANKLIIFSSAYKQTCVDPHALTPNCLNAYIQYIDIKGIFGSFPQGNFLPIKTPPHTSYHNSIKTYV